MKPLNFVTHFCDKRIFHLTLFEYTHMTALIFKFYQTILLHRIKGRIIVKMANSSENLIIFLTSSNLIIHKFAMDENQHSYSLIRNVNDL